MKSRTVKIILFWLAALFLLPPVFAANPMTESSTNNPRWFYASLSKALKGRKIEDICDFRNPVERRVLDEYGAIFLVSESVKPPPFCMFGDAEQVEKFQSETGVESADFNGITVELQPAAMQALLRARTEAQLIGLDITPRDGAEGGRRSYNDTLRLWNSRFEPACLYWHVSGKLSIDRISAIKAMPVKEQVKAVLDLEKQKIYFNTFFNNSIVYSVAPPGTSQHLSMLAFDANEFKDPIIRQILARHGWFRTVRNDSPHFTFLGRKEEELEELGLRKIVTEGGDFWIPNI